MFQLAEQDGRKILIPVEVHIFYIRDSMLKLVEGKVRKKVRVLHSDYRIFDWLKFDSLLLMYEQDGKLIPIPEDFQKLLQFDELMTTATTALEDQNKYLRSVIAELYKKRDDDSVEIANWLEQTYTYVTTLRKTAVLAVSQRFELLSAELGFNVSQTNVRHILSDINMQLSKELDVPQPPKDNFLLGKPPTILDVPSEEGSSKTFGKKQPISVSKTSMSEKPPIKIVENPKLDDDFVSPFEDLETEKQEKSKKSKGKSKEKIPKNIPPAIKNMMGIQDSNDGNEGEEPKSMMPKKLDKEGLDKFMQDVFSGKVVFQPNSKDSN